MCECISARVPRCTVHMCACVYMCVKWGECMWIHSQGVAWWPEYDYPLGPPVANATLNKTTGVWTRAFRVAGAVNTTLVSFGLIDVVYFYLLT